MFVIYSYYLFSNQEKVLVFECAPITKIRGGAYGFCFEFNARLIPHDQELSIKLFLNDVYLARVIEGCNSINVIILFIAF